MEIDPQTDLSFTRILNAPRKAIWDCWTTPHHMKAFFMPKPHILESADIDLRPGGRFNSVVNVDGTRMENFGVILEVIEGQRLVFTDAYTEGWKPAPEPFMTAIVDLQDHDEGGTLYTATARHRSAQAQKAHTDMGFIDGWNTVADQLEAYAQSL